MTKHIGHDTNCQDLSTKCDIIPVSVILTYLCLPLFLQLEPVVHPEAAAHVHHMLLYVCNDLNADFDQLTPEQLAGGPCYGGAHPTFLKCTGLTVIGAWAVGGQVQFPSTTLLYQIAQQCCLRMYGWVIRLNGVTL